MLIFQPSMMKSSPSSRAPGGGDAGSLLQVFCHPNEVHNPHAPGQTRRVVNHPYHTHHTGSDRFVCSFLLRVAIVDESSWQPMSAAQRRRQLRLRSMLRHEQQTVRMDLADALHHSAGPKEKVEMQQNGAPRGQKTTARAGEEVEYEKHVGLRAQKTPPPGERPGILPEPGPQWSDRTVRRSSGETPLLVAASLEAAAADSVDAAALSFLTAQALDDRRRRRGR